MAKRTKDIFEPKSTRVIRVLLSNPRKRWRIATLAKEAQVSLGWAHAVVATLQDQKYVTRDENYRVIVVDAIRLLKRWAAFYSFTTENRFETFHTFEQKLDRFLRGLKKVKASYALTGLSGAWLVAPYVRPVSADIYVADTSTTSEFVKTLDLRPVERGGDIRLVLPYDSGVFYGARSIDRVRVVSNIQLYVDLVNYPARGEEASSQIFRLIEEEWSKALTV
jgi:hypothetical protein